MKKRTEKQKMKRAEDMEVAFYAIDRVMLVRRLQTFMPANYRRLPELNALIQAMLQRTADAVLDAFDGEVHGKQFWPEKKGRKKS